MLVIVIPTCNRSGHLANSLNLLIPQLTENTGLFILDNASTDATPAVVKKIKEANSQKRIVYKRNSVNIGAAANVLRAFEQCSASSDWLWILGDDDRISHDSVSVIISAISANPDAVYIEFSSGLEKISPASEIKFTDTDALLSSEYFSFSNFLFISSGVYSARSIASALRYGYHYQFTFAPHICVLLASIAHAKCNTVISPHKLIFWEKNPDQVWDHEYLAYRFSQIVQILPSQFSRQLLYKRIYESTRFMPPQISLSFLLNLLASRKVTQEYLFIYSELVYFSGLWQKYFILVVLVRFLQFMGFGYLARYLLKAYKEFAKKSPYILPSAFRNGGALGFPGF